MTITLSFAKRLAFCSIIALGSSARAEKAMPPACGLRSLQLIPGNSWTFRDGPAEITIRVESVGPGKNAAGRPVTVVKVLEQYGGRNQVREWTCSPGGLTMGPESFFFSGEPGGGVGSDIVVTQHDNVSYPPDSSLVAGYAWAEKIVGEVHRADTSGSGGKHATAEIELERTLALGPTEPVTTLLGELKGGQKIDFELRGRVTVAAEHTELPVKRTGALWLVRGIGIVKIDDAFDRSWLLAATNIPLARR